MFLLALPFGGRGRAGRRRTGRIAASAGPMRRGCSGRIPPVGVAVFGLLAVAAPGAVLWALPWAGGLLLAIPFCVLTASPRLSARLRDRGLAATPEELAPGDSGLRSEMNAAAL